jgi:hypothetical protein
MHHYGNKNPSIFTFIQVNGCERVQLSFLKLIEAKLLINVLGNQVFIIYYDF